MVLVQIQVLGGALRVLCTHVGSVVDVGKVSMVLRQRVLGLSLIRRRGRMVRGVIRLL